ncbi:MAG TPA: hypothetical protein VNM45_12300 [Bacillus sp. (in: firmicutes)]|nr:hypothetical protein [Bacillus sp. (in: firmicutes)]
MMEEWKVLLQGKDSPLLYNLLLLKKMNEQFEEERKAIRLDFLVRGICEKEVDGLLEDRGLYGEAYISPHLRWERLLAADKSDLRRILRDMMDQSKNRTFAEIPESINDSKIVKCIQTVNEGDFLATIEEIESLFKKKISK